MAYFAKKGSCPRGHLALMVFGVLSAVLLGIAMPDLCHGQSKFDPDDILLDTPAEPVESLFDKDDMDDMEADSDYDGDDQPLEPDSLDSGQSKESTPPEEPYPQSLFSKFWGQSVWTLGYRASHSTGSDPKLINNYLFLRHRVDTLVSEWIFFKLDWKTSLYPKTDHRAEAEDTDFYLDADLREAYLQAGGKASIKLGSQINVWGKADTMAVTDVLSPRDASEFIFFKLEDARFGQWMASTTIYKDNSSLFVFVSPLPEIDKMPVVGTHYSRSLPGSSGLQIIDDSPEFGDMEAGVKLDHFFSKTDLSVMAGRFFANAPVYETRESFLVQTYSAYTMAGTAVSRAFESILVKFELAFKKDFPLQAMNSKGGYQSIKSDIMDGAAGIEYNANGVYFMSIELSNRHIFSDRTALVHGRKDASSLYYTLTRDFLHDTLALEYNFYYHLQEQNHFHNFQATYQLTDAIKVQARYTWLFVSDVQSMMWAYKDEDRVALELSCSF